MEKLDYEVINHFGPSIFKVKIPDQLLKELNDYIDNIVKDEQKSSDLDHGDRLVGDVTQEFKLENDFVSKNGWLKFLADCTGTWVWHEMGKKITKFNLMSTWVVRQFKNEYNPVHWHGGHVSGAGFLKLPSTFGTHKQKKPSKDYQGGNLQLINGTRMFMANSKYNIEPKVGNFYLFPSYMMHTVYPFKDSDEERRSISFNATIDESIFNVYGN